MLGPLLPSTDMSRAASISLQARTWWFGTKQGVAISPESYQSYLAGHPETPTPEPAILARIEDVQRRMGVTGPVPSWQAHAPKADLRVKAADGAAKQGAGGAGGGGDDAPYPEHFKAVIEAVTMGKPVPGIKEIPNTVVRLPVSTISPFCLFHVGSFALCMEIVAEELLKRAYRRLARCRPLASRGRRLRMGLQGTAKVKRRKSRRLYRRTV